MLDQPTDLRSLLSRPDLVCTQAYVGGVWTDAKDGKTFDVVNPARGDVIATVADLSRAEIAAAIDVAAAIDMQRVAGHIFFPGSVPVGRAVFNLNPDLVKRSIHPVHTGGANSLCLHVDIQL